jgi:hypothetical protein
MRLFIICLLGLLYCVPVNAQSGKKPEYDPDNSKFTLGLSAGVQIPDGDMAKRFGWNSNLGGQFVFKNKKNLLFSAEGSFVFGDILHENKILDQISTQSGNIIGADGRFADIRFYERGYNLNLSFGKLFTLSSKQGSGFYVKGGIGFLEHKIRIEVIGNNVPSLTDEYKKGYDRLTNGISFTEFAGFMYLGNTRLINFFIGVESTQAFTKNRRIFNFDTMEKDARSRVDILHGIRAGWIIMLYKRKPAEYYYN